MEEKQHTREEIHLILREWQEGQDSFELCLRHGISDTTLHEWQAAYGANPTAMGNPLRTFMHRVFTGKFLSRRELLAAGAGGAAGVMAGYYFASVGKTREASASMQKAEVVNVSNLKQSMHKLGKYIYLTPEKLGGGTNPVDLETGKTLAWISYWNYGDSCPISHHLAAYPSPDPYKGFEFVNSTQGGDNVLIYGLPTPIKERGLLDKWGQGNHIYRVQFDGQSM